MCGVYIMGSLSVVRDAQDTLIYIFEEQLDPKLLPVLLCADMDVDPLPWLQHLQYCSQAEPQHKVNGGTVKHPGHIAAGDWLSFCFSVVCYCAIYICFCITLIYL